VKCDPQHGKYMACRGVGRNGRFHQVLENTPRCGRQKGGGFENPRTMYGVTSSMLEEKEEKKFVATLLQAVNRPTTSH